LQQQMQSTGTVQQLLCLSHLATVDLQQRVQVKNVLPFIPFLKKNSVT
jgi:hypothetical protein